MREIGSPAISEESAAAAAALESLGFYNQADVKACAYARLLVLGPSKLGKTSAIVGTAPGPTAVINCDGDSALHYPTKLGAKFFALDVAGRKSWQAAISAAEKAVAAKAVRYVTVDSASLLNDNLLAEISKTTDDKFSLYGELKSQLGEGFRRLLKLQAHVIIVCHMTAPLRNVDGSAKGGEEEGILPMMSGAMKNLLPAVVNDVVLFDYVNGRTPFERMFLLGPQKNWSYSGRNVKRTCAVEATIPALFNELGLTL